MQPPLSVNQAIVSHFIGIDDLVGWSQDVQFLQEEEG
jgi:hypothetical protein